MTGRRKFWVVAGASVLGGLAVLLVVALPVVRSQWFGNYVRDKVIATVEDSTGGRVEIGSFYFDPWRLTVQIRNLTLHGTETVAADPLARVALVELRLKLFAGLKKAIDLTYLGVTEPKVNLIVNPDGTTNVPSPKVKKSPSETSGLDTVVDLAIGQFKVDRGLLLYSQRASQFSANGNDLHVLLNFNSFNSSYEGRVAIDPLVLATGSGSPLRVNVNLPVLIERNAVSISGGRLVTDLSQVLVNAGLRDLNSPKITARLNANLSLAEMQKSFNLPLDVRARDLPKSLRADLEGSYEDKNAAIRIQSLHAVLGQSNFTAAGSLGNSSDQPVLISGRLALGELSRLAKVGDTQINGALRLEGRARLDVQNNYSVNGEISSRDLSVKRGATSLPDIHLSSPFHVDPYLISLDGLKMDALGGELAGKLFVEKLARLSFEGHMAGFSIPVVTRAASGHQLGYSGSVGGSITAKDNLKARGTSGFVAQANLVIAAGSGGVPISGQIDGQFNGSTSLVELKQSYLALPNSRVDLSGNINKQLDIDLISRNLNDFLPAVNFGSIKPQTSLPVTLRGGAASLKALITGKLSDPHISAHASIDNFAVQGSPIQHAAFDLQASPAMAAVSNGVLTSYNLRSTFDTSIGLQNWQPKHFSPLNANVSIPDGNLTELLAVAGEKNLPASGRLNADVYLRGTYGDPLGKASLQVLNGVAYGQPFDKVQVNLDLTPQLITLNSLELNAAGGRLSGHATFRHPKESFQLGHAEFHVSSSDLQLAHITPLQRRSPGAAGLLNLVADGAGDLRASSDFQFSNINADFSARALRVNNQSAGDLFAKAHTDNGNVAYNLHSNFAGSGIQVDGVTSLSKGFITKAAASIKNLAVEKALSIAGRGDISAAGLLSANATLAGPIASPDAVVDLTLAKGHVYVEPVNKLSLKLHYSETQVEVSTLDLDLPAGTLTASGNWKAGHVEAHLNSSDLDLSKSKYLTQVEPGLSGGIKLVADIAGDLNKHPGQPEILLSRADAEVNTHSLRANGQNLGDLHATAKTHQQIVQFDLQSTLAHANLHAAGETKLGGDYPTHAKLTFGNVHYVNIAPFIPSDDSAKPAFDALVEGEASVDGPMLNMDALVGRLQLNQMLVKTTPPNSAAGTPVSRKVQLHNEGPAILSLDHSVIKVQQFKIAGPSTNLQIGGALSLKDGRNPLGLTLKGNADLGILQDADRNFYSSGAVVLDATVHGTFAKPMVNGYLQLKKANVNYTDSPNGLSNGNGVIVLNGTTASFQNVTGESGGGKIVISGFAGYTQTAVIFNLRAKANKVRARYSGASVTSSADVSLAGSTRRSTLHGTVTVHRIAYSSSSDIGSLLSNASVPPSSPAAPSPLLSGMRLDLRIVTAPDLRVVTAYSQKISLMSNLSVRGTAQDPGVVGSVNVTNGELVFFGNTYTVNGGSINFYNPNQILPILNLSLETITQGVDVTLGVTGPINDLKLSYRSDPALSFEQIVQLLATNTTPSDPTIAAHQPTPAQQSASQMGESAVLGQAVANPLASRVQRVFGLTQFKIDPSFSGSNGQPSARVTLQQKIASNLTFTYITDVTQTNSEIVRVQFDVTPKVSAVALRDYNGNVSLEFFYKFQVR